MTEVSLPLRKINPKHMQWTCSLDTRCRDARDKLHLLQCHVLIIIGLHGGLMMVVRSYRTTYIIVLIIRLR